MWISIRLPNAHTHTHTQMIDLTCISERARCDNFFLLTFCSHLFFIFTDNDLSDVRSKFEQNFRLFFFSFVLLWRPVFASLFRFVNFFVTFEHLLWMRNRPIQTPLDGLDPVLFCVVDHIRSSVCVRARNASTPGGQTKGFESNRNEQQNIRSPIK